MSKGTQSEQIDREIDPIEQEIAQLEAETAAALSEKESADRERKENQSLRLAQAKIDAEKAKIAARDARALTKLESEHGPIGRAWDKLDTDQGMVAFKKPNHLIFKRWQDNGAKDSHTELEKLVKPSLIHPTSWVDFQKIVEDEPATLARAASLICKLAGFRKADLEGK